MVSVASFPPRPFFSGPRLEIRAIGLRETMPPCFIERPHGTRIRDCLIMLFHDRFLVGQPPHQLEGKAGSAVVWVSGAAQYYGNPWERWSHSWIHCDGEDITRALQDSGLEDGHPVVLDDARRIERYLQNVYEDVTATRAPDYEILRNTLANLIREVGRSQSCPFTRLVPEVWVRARQSIEARYHEPLDLETLAREAHLSSPHFCTGFREHFGVTPIAYLISRRMEAAATLLRCTDLPVGEVGRRVGYADVYYFSKLFKQRFAVSPSRFRAAPIK